MQWFKKYPETALVVTAIVFILILVGMYLWGTGTVFTAVNQAVNYPMGGGAAPQFNVGGASMLDFRGISTSSVPSSSNQ